MTFSNAQKARCGIGSLNYSGYTTGLKLPIKVDMLDVTVLNSTSFDYIPGQDDATASLDFLLDSDGTAGDWGQMTAWKTAQPTPMWFAPQGLTTGLYVWLINADQAGFEVNSDPSSAVKGSLNAQATGGADLGVVVEDFTAITADGNGTARDGLAASTNGGVAHLHTSAFSGFTSDAVTIEHSVNGSTGWATLVTFTTATATGSDRQVIAAGTSVRQFLRVVDDVTGSGSITRAVFFARR